MMGIDLDFVNLRSEIYAADSRIPEMVRPCHICTRTGVGPATSAPGLGSPCSAHMLKPCRVYRTECGVCATGDPMG